MAISLAILFLQDQSIRRLNYFFSGLNSELYLIIIHLYNCFSNYLIPKEINIVLSIQKLFPSQNQIRGFQYKLHQFCRHLEVLPFISLEKKMIKTMEKKRRQRIMLSTVNFQLFLDILQEPTQIVQLQPQVPD